METVETPTLEGMMSLYDIEIRRCPHCGRFGSEDGYYAPMVGNKCVESLDDLRAELHVFCNEACYESHEKEGEV